MKDLKKTYNSPYIKVEEILTEGLMKDAGSPGGANPETPIDAKEANFDFDETEWDDTDDKNAQK